MSKLVFLVEEYSTKVLLHGLLPRLHPELEFQCIHHEGKQDLERSIPRKLRAWRAPGIRFVVVRDNDGADCRAVKRSLLQLCAAGQRPDTLVRIACQELEAWYLGDPDALADAFEDESLRTLPKRARYRDPDAVRQPSLALAELVPQFQKVSGARAMATRLTYERSTSASFRALLDGIGRLVR